MPQFKYFLSKNQAVQEGSKVWTTPIPLSRHQAGGQPRQDTGISVSHGDYFSAVREFLEQDKFKTLVFALSKYLNQDLTFEALSEIRIFLEKHGEFYHPARVETVIKGLTIPFVLNVAISSTGKSCIQREYRLLKKLNVDFSLPFLPKVYGQDRVVVNGSRREVQMFLGEWFDGYSEFHMSHDPADDKLKIVVWDVEHGKYFLTAAQSMELYRQAAMILTTYYNPETFEQISSWHHAAGDFVIRCQNEEVDLRLISVRHYGSMFGHGKGDEFNSEVPNESMIWQALLVFFLNLVLRMRLDRLDGVGEIVWADTVAVGNTLQGVLDALALKPAAGRVKMPSVDGFLAYLRTCRRTDLYDLNKALVSTYHPRSPDVGVIKQHLKQHVEDLYNAIQ
jgi:hypothetical protein